MTFGVALGSALTTLVGGVLFAAVGDMIGWDVLGKGLAVAVGVVAVALALVRKTRCWAWSGSRFCASSRTLPGDD
jgi:hypothetical protein